MLNTVSLVSIYFFDWLLLPLAQGQQKWFHRNIGWFYQILWLLPVVGVSLYLNVSPPFTVIGPARLCERIAQSTHMMYRMKSTSSMDRTERVSI